MESSTNSGTPIEQEEASHIGRTNKLRTLDELDREIAAQEAGLERYRFPASQIRVEPGRVLAGDREFALTREGERRLCKRFQAPPDYLAGLRTTLRARILQEHFAEGRHNRSRITDKASCVLSRGGEFLDLSRSDLFTLDNASVVQGLRDGVGTAAASLEVQNLHLDDESFCLDIVSPQMAEEVRPGDILRGGVHVEHSQLDGTATQVMAFVVRLVCANGMVQRRCLGKKSRSTPRTRRLPANRPEARETQMAQVRKLVTETWAGLQEKLDAIRRLGEKKVEVKHVLEQLLRRAHLLSRDLLTRLLEAWVEEGSESSAFGALNALTRVATHAQDLSALKRNRLARLAGIYANHDVDVCPQCYSLLAR